MNESLRKPGMYGSVALCIVAWIFATVAVAGASTDSHIAIYSRWWRGQVNGNIIAANLWGICVDSDDDGHVTVTSSAARRRWRA